jgi:hypothetical protein
MWLYVLLLFFIVAGLIWVYRVMGGGGPVSASDLRASLEDVLRSAGSAADRLRAALAEPPSGDVGRARLNDIAEACRKEFQTSYYRALGLRPLPGDREASEALLAAREALVGALERYEWASRMASAEAIHNPAILRAARDLVAAGDEAQVSARRSLATAPSALSR